MKLISTNDDKVDQDTVYHIEKIVSFKRIVHGVCY
jgi:hypothetical protein